MPRQMAKEQAHYLVDKMPENSTWDDLIHEIYVRQVIEEGLTDTNEYEVQLKQRMVQRSKEVVAIVDSSKWGQVAFASLAPVDRLDHVIADGAAPIDMVAALRERGIRVTLV